MIVGSIAPRSQVGIDQILKIRNRESRFHSPVRLIRNWESKIDSFSILFTIPLIPIPPKCVKESESRFLGIGSCHL